jgi:uncharacterized protein
MRIAIIGGRGLIGSALTQEALHKGHQVVILSRRASEVNQVNERIIEFRWDGKDPTKLAKIIEGCDALINLAGESIGKTWWTKKRKAVILTSRIEPAEAIVAAYKNMENPPGTLIQPSGVGYYGIKAGEKDESSAPGTDYLATLAVKWEDATKEVESKKVRRIVIRSAAVFEPHHGVLPQLMLPFQLMVGGRLGSGKQFVPWIHIQDEVRAILYLIENPECSGIYNLIAPTPITNQELGRILGKAMGRPYWFPIPVFALKLVLGQMSTLVLDGQQVFPKRLIESGFKFTYPEIQSALEALLSRKAQS